MSRVAEAMLSRRRQPPASDAELDTATVRFGQAALEAGIVDPWSDDELWAILDPLVVMMFAVDPDRLSAAMWHVLAAAVELGAGIVEGERAAA